MNYKIITDPSLLKKEGWTSYVLNHPKGNVFQTPEMFDVYDNTRYYEPVVFAVIDSEKNILAVLLTVIQRESYDPFGFFTSRAIIIGGPLIANDNVDILVSLLNAYNSIMKGKVVYSQIRNFFEQTSPIIDVFRKSGFNFENHLNILIDLSGGTKTLWINVKRNRKDGINKARKQGFTFNHYINYTKIEMFYSLLSELYDNIKLPFPDISFFYSAKDLLKDKVKWFTLEYNGHPIIVLFALSFNNVVYAHSIGISQSSDILKLRPVDIFYWEVISWCAENGFKVFDWMGAGKPDEKYGVRQFKLQYGGEVYNFGRYLKTHRGILYKFGKFGLSVLQKLKR